MAQASVKRDIPQPEEDATESWLRRKGPTLLVLVLSLVIVAAILWPRMVVNIGSGQAGVLFRWFSGTERGRVFDEGVHVTLPWDSMVVYDIRLQTQEREYTLLTRTGLPLTLRVAIRYQPDLRMLPQLHVAVGPNYLDKVVFPETEAVLRRYVGQYDPEEVYTSKRGFLESVLMGSLTQAESRFVIIDDVLVKSIELPQALREEVERKLVLQEQEKAYVHRLGIERKEAERKEIEAAGIAAYQSTLARTLTPDLLRWQGVEATRDLAQSPNTKTIIVGAGKDGLPLILGNDR
ncbi:regulator of protease activity HflC (stomatin/prohibitin superfamily) [Azospirillum agricola]|uniref:prohibitin family protein n=1 Tax=Azospirillum agricola TaxID=1720247 RepID=UPI001AE6D659|nr:prohibitin family protein [Azospirillum agricola]MBP2229017.1 regulator of protease activity HflC (stomatin/prohibitin superfamily) [Azospirillum agricola]